MKGPAFSKVVIVALLLFVSFSLTAQESGGFRLGLQMSSDSYAGILVLTPFLEAAAKLQVVQTDEGDTLADILVFGGHAGVLFTPFGDTTSLSLGAELRNGVSTGEAEYAEYVDAGVRLGVNYYLGDHCLLTGLLYPVWISTRETEGLDDWELTATFAKAGVAVSLLF